MDYMKDLQELFKYVKRLDKDQERRARDWWIGYCKGAKLTDEEKKEGFEFIESKK